MQSRMEMRTRISALGYLDLNLTEFRLTEPTFSTDFPVRRRRPTRALPSATTECSSGEQSERVQPDVPPVSQVADGVVTRPTVIDRVDAVTSLGGMPVNIHPQPLVGSLEGSGTDPSPTRPRPIGMARNGPERVRAPQGRPARTDDVARSSGPNQLPRPPLVARGNAATRTDRSGLPPSPNRPPTGSTRQTPPAPGGGFRSIGRSPEEIARAAEEARRQARADRGRWFQSAAAQATRTEPFRTLGRGTSPNSSVGRALGGSRTTPSSPGRSPLPGTPSGRRPGN